MKITQNYQTSLPSSADLCAIIFNGIYCRVSAAKIYLNHSTKIAKTRSHRAEWQTDSYVQKQWFMVYTCPMFILFVKFSMPYIYSLPYVYSGF